MKDLNMVRRERYELSKELRKLILSIESDKSLLNSIETIKRLYMIVGLIRTLDWILNDSNLSFNEFCLNTDDSIEYEFDFGWNEKK